MKYFSLLLLVTTGFLASTTACSSAKKTGAESLTVSAPWNGGEVRNAIVPDTFALPDIPETIRVPEERATYLMMHYWDRFDFHNRSLMERPEITEQAFVDYINILGYVPKEKADESLLYTLEKASVDTVMYDHFAMLFDKYLYDLHSPFRNEEMYIPVLEKLIASPLIAEERRAILVFQQEMALKNRVGQKAANFEYTLASGKSYALYDLESEYTVLLFSNPGCRTCETVIARLHESKALNRALSLNTPARTMLTLLTVYPDEDLDEWLGHLDTMPAAWIHGYDKGMRITRETRYDIRAIPSIYLLDKDKMVILKDTSIETLESFFSTGG